MKKRTDIMSMDEVPESREERDAKRMQLRRMIENRTTAPKAPGGGMPDNYTPRKKKKDVWLDELEGPGISDMMGALVDALRGGKGYERGR